MRVLRCRALGMLCALSIAGGSGAIVRARACAVRVCMQAGARAGVASEASFVCPKAVGMVVGACSLRMPRMVPRAGHALCAVHRGRQRRDRMPNWMPHWLTGNPPLSFACTLHGARVVVRLVGAVPHGLAHVRVAHLLLRALLHAHRMPHWMPHWMSGSPNFGVSPAHARAARCTGLRWRSCQLASPTCASPASSCTPCSVRIGCRTGCRVLDDAGQSTNFICTRCTCVGLDACARGGAGSHDRGSLGDPMHVTRAAVSCIMPAARAGVATLCPSSILKFGIRVRYFRYSVASSGCLRTR